MSKSKHNTPAKPSSSADVSRIQSTVSRQHDGQLPKGSYVGRMQAAVAHNAKNDGKK